LPVVISLSAYVFAVWGEVLVSTALVALLCADFFSRFRSFRFLRAWACCRNPHHVRTTPHQYVRI